MSKRSTRRREVEDFEGRAVPMRRASNDTGPLNDDDVRDRSYIRRVRPMSAGQTQLLHAIDTHNLVLALGPAGTGKTYLAIAKAVEAVEAGRVERIVLTRPAVEAGESLGYLPATWRRSSRPISAH
jgi:phosphate starvation-inducible PhoH-like protein